MSHILIRNPHAVALVDTALGPVTFHAQGAGMAPAPIHIVAKQQDFLPVVMIENVGQFLRGGFRGHDREFSQIVLYVLYQKIEDAKGSDVSFDAVEILTENAELEQALARTWSTPELKAAVAELLPKVPGVARDSSQPRHIAIWAAVDRFSRLEKDVLPENVGFTPSANMTLAMPSRASDRAKCEQLFPVDEWKERIAQAANLYLDAWYALNDADAWYALNDVKGR